MGHTEEVCKNAGRCRMEIKEGIRCKRKLGRISGSRFPKDENSRGLVRELGVIAGAFAK